MCEYTKISTMLYGGKSPFSRGHEAPLSADEIYCCAKSCQFRTNKTCILMRKLLHENCPFGKVDTTKGFTSRAKKYSSFRSKYRNDPTYGELSRPQNTPHLRLADDKVYIRLDIVSIISSFDEVPQHHHIITGTTNNILVQDQKFGVADPIWLDQNELDAQAIIDICAYTPCNGWSGDISQKYQEQIVPLFLDDLETFWPERYEQVIALEPKLADMKPNHVGRKAYVSTLAQGIEILDRHNNRFEIVNDKLVCHDYNDDFGGPGGIKMKHATLSMAIEDDMIVEIRDNDWVVKGHTRFV